MTTTMMNPTPLPVKRDETARQDVVAALAGSWRGRLTDVYGAAESFNLERVDDHRVPGQVFLYTTPTGIAAGMRLLEASERAFVALIGPYFDPTESTMVVTVLEGSCEPGRLTGTFHTRRYNWRDTLRTGAFTASRVEQVSRAA